METSYLGAWGMRTNDKRLEVRLPSDLHDDLKRAGLVLDRLPSDLVRRAVADLVAKAKKAAGPAWPTS